MSHLTRAASKYVYAGGPTKNKVDGQSVVYENFILDYQQWFKTANKQLNLNI